MSHKGVDLERSLNRKRPSYTFLINEVHNMGVSKCIFIGIISLVHLEYTPRECVVSIYPIIGPAYTSFC